MVLVVADSNALMSVFRLSLNLDEALGRILGPWEIVVPSPVMDELRRLSSTNRHARGALSLASRYRIVEEPGSADDAVLSAAIRLGGLVFTNDRELMQKARDSSVPRIFFKGMAVLKAEGLPDL